MKLYESELKVMQLLWENGDMTASKIAETLKGTIGWSRTTTYTVIKKCIEKHAIERENTKYLCRAAVSKSEVQSHETKELLNKMYDGSANLLVMALIDNKMLTTDQIADLRALLEDNQE